MTILDRAIKAATGKKIKRGKSSRQFVRTKSGEIDLDHYRSFGDKIKISEFPASEREELMRDIREIKAQAVGQYEEEKSKKMREYLKNKEEFDEASKSIQRRKQRIFF